MSTALEFTRRHGVIAPDGHSRQGTQLFLALEWRWKITTVRPSERPGRRIPHLLHRRRRAGCQLAAARPQMAHLRPQRAGPLRLMTALAYVGIQATHRSLAQADRRSGRRNLWLRAPDAADLGFDS